MLLYQSHESFLREPRAGETFAYVMIATPGAYQLLVHEADEVIGTHPDVDTTSWVVLHGVIMDGRISYEVTWYYDSAVAHDFAEDVVIEAIQGGRRPVDVILLHVRQQTQMSGSTKVYVLDVIGTARVLETGELL